MILDNVLAGSGTAGNLTNDAHLAAIAIEYGYTLYSADNDFNALTASSTSIPLPRPT